MGLKKMVIFCDFDGTITEKDNITSIMEHFGPPGWETIKNQILDQKISIQKGVGKMFSLLDSKKKEEIIDFAIHNVKIRTGFQAFVNYCSAQNILLLITSGGIDFFIYPILSSFAIPKEQIYCNSSDFTGECISILWPHSCDDLCMNDCGMCKPKIIRQFSDQFNKKIVIGDSITDLSGAKLADLVIARDFLLEKCREHSLPHTEFHTFYDVINLLRRFESEVNFDD